MRGGPSMTALLAVLAIAGYQNRDKLAEMLGGAAGRDTGGAPGGGAGRMPSTGTDSGTGTGTMPAGGIGGMIADSLQDLLDRFRGSGHGETADSWVAKGPNRPCDAAQLEASIGADTLEALARQTGLSRQEIVTRLCRNLPDAVDRYTPDGRVPTA
jgi:uncharacterized protein YidB (DUF937 family)